MRKKESEKFYDPSIGSMVQHIPYGKDTSLEDEPFIPSLPLSLARTLAPLPGKAFGLFLVVWRESVMKRSLTVKVTTTAAHQWGISHQQKRRALRTLQAAGLVRVDVKHGKNPLVTLCLHVSPWAFRRKPSR